MNPFPSGLTKSESPGVIRADLTIKLFAGAVTVAESTDAALWQEVLAAISGLGPRSGPSGQQQAPRVPSLDRRSADHARAGADDAEGGTDTRPTEPLVGSLSTALDVTPAELVAACDPRLESPYLHLDPRHWQAFKRNTGTRGSDSVAPIVLATTLLHFWFKAAGLGVVTVAAGQKVLTTIDAKDKNPARGLRACRWLQVRDDTVRLNPTQYDLAAAVARCYCTQRPIEPAEPG